MTLTKVISQWLSSQFKPSKHLFPGNAFLRIHKDTYIHIAMFTNGASMNGLFITFVNNLYFKFVIRKEITMQ